LQLARNDKAAASGRLTAARQRRNAAACASSEAYVQHFTLATIPASNATNIRVGKVREDPCANRSLWRTRVPKHTDSIPRAKGAALTPCLKAGAPAPEKE
jgi:hypothetical protein